MPRSLSITDASDWAIPEGEQFEPVHVESSPAAFGAGVAQGEEQASQGLDRLAQGVTQAAVYQQNINAQYALNKFNQARTNIEYGDGTTANPGFYATRGEGAMRAWPDARQNIGNIRDQISGGLSGPARLAFDRESTYMMSRSLETMGRHYAQQLEAYGDETANATIDNAVRRVGLQWNDDQTYADAVHQVSGQIDAMKGPKGWSDEEAEDQRKKAVGRITVSRVYGQAATDPAGARKFLDKSFNGGAIDARTYDELDLHLKAREDEQDGLAASKDALGKAATAPAPTVDVNDSAAMLRQFEGLRTTPYWDVNHWRVGYGSDTITRPDGSVEAVTPFTRITPEDAERDLARRARISSLQVENAIGPQAWDKLPAAAKASLTSVAYNYGHFPSQLVGAAQSGDPAALADAVRSLSSNPGRRAQEAAAILGKFTPSGARTSAAPTMTIGVEPSQPGMVMPSAAPIPPASGAPAEPQVTPAVAQSGEAMSPETAPVQHASADNSAFAPAPAAQTPIDMRANAIRAIEARSDLSDRAKQIAIRNVNETFTAAQIAAEQDAKARQAQHEAAMEKYYGFANRGEFSQGFAALSQDPTLGEKEKDQISEMLTRRSGESNPRDYGNGFSDVRRRMLLPHGDPNLIHSKRQILQAENDGLLTPKGADEAMRNLDGLNKEDEGGVIARQNGIMAQVKQAFVHDLDIGPVKIPDQKGLEHYNEFLGVFIPQFDKWREKGNDPFKFPLFDQKSIKEVMDQIYPTKQRLADRMNMGAEAAGQQAAAGLEPSAPEGINSDRWSAVMAQRPVGGRGQVPTDDWARMVGQLAADPKRMAPIWDQSQFGRNGIKAAAILGQLGIDLTLGKPEDVGAGPTVPIKLGRESRRPAAPDEPLPSLPGPL